MRKIGKIVAIVIASILLLSLVVPMAFRGKISRIVKNEANKMLTARLDFEGLDISLLRHFPNASLELEGLSLVGTDRFEGDTIVAADRISVVVNPFSLLGDGGFIVSKIILDTPSLHAAKLSDGAVNWDVMKPSDQDDDAPSETETSSGEESAFKLSVKDFRISDASIRYDDDSLGMHFFSTPLNLRLRGDLSARTSTLDLRLDMGATRLVSGGVPLMSDIEASLEADILADLENNRFEFSDNHLTLNAVELTLDGWVDLDDRAVRMDLKAGCDKVQFKDVLSLIPAFYTREFRNLSAKGEMDLNLWAKGEMRERMFPAFELKTDIRNGSFQYTTLPKAVTDINMALKISNPGREMDRTEVNLSRFGLKMGDNRLDATFYATTLATDPEIRFSTSGKIDLGMIHEVYPLEEGITLDGRVNADLKFAGALSSVSRKRYDKLSATGNFVIENVKTTLPALPTIVVQRAAASITPEAMTLGDFNARIGGSDIEANGQLTGYLGYLLKKEMLGGRLYVKSTLLDLNQFMTTTAEEQVAEAEARNEELPEEPMQVIEVPKNMALSLSTDLKKILLQEMVIENVVGEMRLSDGILSLNKLQMNLFEGRATASGSYSTRDMEHPRVQISAEVANASFEQSFRQMEMIQKMVPLFEKTGGRYSLSINLATLLDQQMMPELKTLTASGEIRSRDIHVQNIKAFDTLADVLKNDALRRIQARDIAIRFAIRDGRIETRPFDLKMGQIKINLSGSTGLDQSIDYVARVALPAGTTGSVLQNIPVKIGGTFSSPSVTLGVKEAAEDALKQSVGKVLGDKINALTGNKTPSGTPEEQAAQMRENTERSAAKLIQTAEEQRQKLIDAASSKGRLARVAAEAAGNKLVEEAQKQAERMKADTEAKIAELGGESAPADK